MKFQNRQFKKIYNLFSFNSVNVFQLIIKQETGFVKIMNKSTSNNICLKKNLFINIGLHREIKYQLTTE